MKPYANQTFSSSASASAALLRLLGRVRQPQLELMRVRRLRMHPRARAPGQRLGHYGRMLHIGRHAGQLGLEPASASSAAGHCWNTLPAVPFPPRPRLARRSPHRRPAPLRRGRPASCRTTRTPSRPARRSWAGPDRGAGWTPTAGRRQSAPAPRGRGRGQPWPRARPRSAAGSPARATAARASACRTARPGRAPPRASAGAAGGRPHRPQPGQRSSTRGARAPRGGDAGASPPTGCRTARPSTAARPAVPSSRSGSRPRPACPAARRLAPRAPSPGRRRTGRPSRRGRPARPAGPASCSLMVAGRTPDSCRSHSRSDLEHMRPLLGTLRHADLQRCRSGESRPALRP